MSTIIHTFHKNSVLIKHCPLRHPGYEPGAQLHFVKINPLNELKISTICPVATLAVTFCGIYLPRRDLDGGLRQTHDRICVQSPQTTDRGRHFITDGVNTPGRAAQRLFLFSRHSGSSSLHERQS